MDFPSGAPGFCLLKSVVLFASCFSQNLVGAFWSVVDFLTSILSRRILVDLAMLQCHLILPLAATTTCRCLDLCTSTVWWRGSEQLCMHSFIDIIYVKRYVRTVCILWTYIYIYLYTFAKCVEIPTMVVSLFKIKQAHSCWFEGLL